MTRSSLRVGKSFPERKSEAKKRGKLRGIGIANAIEISAGPAPAPMPESAEIKFDATGAVTLWMGTHSHGQGHEITFAQIAADMLGHRAARHSRALWRYRHGRIRHRHLRQPLDHHRQQFAAHLAPIA